MITTRTYIFIALFGALAVIGYAQPVEVITAREQVSGEIGQLADEYRALDHEERSLRAWATMEHRARTQAEYFAWRMQQGQPVQPVQPVEIREVTVEEIARRVPGIGPVKAAALVEEFAVVERP